MKELKSASVVWLGLLRSTPVVSWLCSGDGVAVRMKARTVVETVSTGSKVSDDAGEIRVEELSLVGTTTALVWDQ